MTAHALWRSLVLVFLGVFLRSLNSSQTNFTFEDTLSQIGLGYTFLFCSGPFPSTCPVGCARAHPGRILAAPLLIIRLRRPNLTSRRRRPAPPWPHHPNGFAAHWNKNSNLAWAFDTWFLNLFPRKKPFTHNGGGYATLSFIPTLATMILGLLAGGVLRRTGSGPMKVAWLAIAGCIGLACGWGLGELGICPVVKRIWTPSWVLYSGGWCFLFLAALFAVLDIAKVRFWAFPLRVIGMNSIAAYCMAGLFESFIARNLTTHLGDKPFAVAGHAFEPLLHGAGVLLVLWLILFWMYRRKLFLRI